MSDDIMKVLSDIIGGGANNNASHSEPEASGSSIPESPRSEKNDLFTGPDIKSILKSLSLLGSSEETENRCRLLSAIRPYLPETKAETLETAILIIRLSDAAGLLFGKK